mmetsp:Transcript_16257/g.46856  ORF Transcript_16257/g.46856 Transcript_16257/m.46856 type:complete len:129 (-) Transcript_16257:87-473(-)
MLHDLTSKPKTRISSRIDSNSVSVLSHIPHTLHDYSFSDSGEFSLSGADNLGIVHRLTSALSRNGLSIDKMVTAQEEAPFGGSTLFKVLGVATASEPLSMNFSPDRVRDELESLGEEMNCDVKLEDVE